MPIRKIARIVNAAYKDADIARRASHTPEFRKAVSKDRRGALSEFTTVKHALRDRERLAKQDGGKAGTRGSQGASVSPTAKSGSPARARKK
jgi:hypothetical protein